MGVKNEDGRYLRNTGRSHKFTKQKVLSGGERGVQNKKIYIRGYNHERSCQNSRKILGSSVSQRISKKHRGKENDETQMTIQNFQNFLNIYSTLSYNFSEAPIERFEMCPKFQKRFSITFAKLLFQNVSRFFSKFLQNYPPASWKCIYIMLNFAGFF